MKMYDEYKKDPSRFIEIDTPINTLEDFEQAYSLELRDFNSAGVVAAHQGLPLSKMNKNVYEVYGEEIQVAKTQRDLCKTTISEAIKKI